MVSGGCRGQDVQRFLLKGQPQAPIHFVHVAVAASRNGADEIESVEQLSQMKLQKGWVVLESDRLPFLLNLAQSLSTSAVLDNPLCLCEIWFLHLQTGLVVKS